MMVHSLIEAYGLLPKMTLVSAAPAKLEDLLLFHSEDYVDFLRQVSETDDIEKLESSAEEYGLGENYE